MRGIRAGAGSHRRVRTEPRTIRGSEADLIIAGGERSDVSDDDEARRLKQIAVAHGGAAIGNAQMIDHGGHAVHAAQMGYGPGLVDNVGHFALKNQRTVRQAEVDRGMELMALVWHTRQRGSCLCQHRFATQHDVCLPI